MACVPNWQLNGRWPTQLQNRPRRPRWVSYRLRLVAYQLHREVKGIHSSTTEENGTSRRLLAQNRCTQVTLLLFFNNPHDHAFPALLHTDNVNAAPRVSEESGTEGETSWQWRQPQLSQLCQPSTASMRGVYAVVALCVCVCNKCLSVWQACLQHIGRACMWKHVLISPHLQIHPCSFTFFSPWRSERDLKNNL